MESETATQPPEQSTPQGDVPEVEHERSEKRSRRRDRSSDSRSRRRKRDKGRHRSRSREKGRRHSSRKRSRTPPRRRKRTQFDVKPEMGTLDEEGLSGAIIPAPITTSVIPQDLLVPPEMNDPNGNPPLLYPGMGLPGLIQNSALTQPSAQATRHARRVYVGGLPPSANEQSIATFMSNALAAIGGTSQGPGVVVVNVYINREKNFAFVEFRTVEETSNAMALDGVMFEGVSVRVRRPNDYNPTAAASLGPSIPNPTLNLEAVGLHSSGTSITDAHERIFVGGIPYYLTEEQCRELLGTFGDIKSFDLVKDRDTGQSKGYGFVVYVDATVTDIACQGLNGLKMGDRVLTVRRATETQAANALMPANAITSLSGATRIVTLEDAVSIEELQDEEAYQEICEDMLEECERYGAVNKVQIPRPAPPDQVQATGLGKVIIEFEDVNVAVKARNAMHGRKFAGRIVTAAFLPEEHYMAGNFDYSM